MKGFLRFIVNLCFLVAGVLLGVVWGVRHPVQAENIAQQEQVDQLKIQAAVSSAKIQFLQKYRPADTQAISDEQAKLDETNKELSGESSQNTP